MFLTAYNRAQAVAYARRWAFGRNPLFYDFHNLGGDCTNFISQCVLAGSCQMNPTPETGWYFYGLNNRSPSWTGVPFFYEFLTKNRGLGPYAREVEAGGLELGDVIQLGRGDGSFYHSLLVTGFARDTYLVTAHTYDALDRPLNSYSYGEARFLHIEGVRTASAEAQNCFPALLAGRALPSRS